MAVPRRLSELTVAALWVAVVVAGILALSALAGVRAGFVLNTAQTLVPLALLGTVGIVVTAALLRRWTLAAVALAVAAGLVVLVLPAVRSGQSPPSTTTPAAALRVFSANLRFGNPDGRPIAREAMASGADVIALQELTEVHLESLRAEGVLDAYPHAVVDARSGAFGSAILSKLPLADARVDDLGGLPMSRATVTVAGRPVDLLNVHTLSPMSGGNFDVRDRQLDALADLAAGSDGSDGPRAGPSSWSATSTPTGGTRPSGACSTRAWATPTSRSAEAWPAPGPTAGGFRASPSSTTCSCRPRSSRSRCGRARVGEATIVPSWPIWPCRSAGRAGTLGP